MKQYILYLGENPRPVARSYRLKDLQRLAKHMAGQDCHIQHLEIDPLYFSYGILKNGKRHKVGEDIDIIQAQARIIRLPGNEYWVYRETNRAEIPVLIRKGDQLEFTGKDIEK